MFLNFQELPSEPKMAEMAGNGMVMSCVRSSKANFQYAVPVPRYQKRFGTLNQKRL